MRVRRFSPPLGKAVSHDMWRNLTGKRFAFPPYSYPPPRQRISKFSANPATLPQRTLLRQLTWRLPSVQSIARHIGVAPQVARYEHRSGGQRMLDELGATLRRCARRRPSSSTTTGCSTAWSRAATSPTCTASRPSGLRNDEKRDHLEEAHEHDHATAAQSAAST